MPFPYREANYKALAARMLWEIMPKNVRVLTDKRKTKPCILEDIRTMTFLAHAFAIGATQTEAAAFAHCSRSTIKKHLQEKTKVEYTADRFSEPIVVGFDELVCMWKCHLTYLCKIVIYDRISNPDPRVGVKDAWKLLERREPQEWGKPKRRSVQVV